MTLKDKIISVLEGREYDSLFDLWSENNRTRRIIISLTYDKQKILAWRAIEGIGILSKAMSAQQPQAVRNLVGNLLWMIRDESGGIGWSSPEMLGEIVRNNPVLCADIAPIIVFFHDEEPLLPGILWAFGRIGELHKELMLPSVKEIMPYLDHTSPIIRGLTVWALGKTVAHGSIAKLKDMTADSGLLTIYNNNRLIKTTVGSIALNAIHPGGTKKN